MQQTSQPPQPSQPAPATPQPVVVNVQPGTGHMSAEYVRGLRVKLDDLRNELQDAASRRRTISEQLRSADSRAVPGLEQRMAVLDRRIVEIETDISATGALLRNAPPELLAMTQEPGPREAFELANRVSDEVVPIVAILSVFVFSPFAIALSRFIWKRAVAPPPRAGAALDHAASQRLDQLQQSVDTIAVEIERISEGQRFVTKILADRDRASLTAGSAEPARASRKSGTPVERG